VRACYHASSAVSPEACPPKFLSGCSGAPTHACRKDTPCSAYGVRHVGWHVLRHTYATLLCQRGVPLPNVQALLGHTTITMTARYAHAAPNDIADWVYRALVQPNVRRDSSRGGHHM